MTRPIPHGTYSAYTNHNCRCTECRAANAAYTRKRSDERRRLIEADPTLVAHGLTSTYDNWGCRCPECREAHNKAERERRQKKREAAQARLDADVEVVLAEITELLNEIFFPDAALRYWSKPLDLLDDNRTPAAILAAKDVDGLRSIVNRLTAMAEGVFL